MNTLGKLIAKTADLVEAEGRLLREHVVRVVAACLMFVAALVFALIGVGLLVTAAIYALSPALTPGGALATCGGICLIAAGGVAWYARRKYS